MDWNEIESNWSQFKSTIKQKWSKLTDADLDVIGGRRSRLEDSISKRYGFADEHIRKEIEDWLRWQTRPPPHSGEAKSRTEVLRFRS